MKSGDRQAFRRIYELHAPDLIRYGRRFSHESTTVKDCIHDLFVYLWSSRERLGDTDSIARYLMVALRRRIVKAMSESRKTTDLESSPVIFSADLALEDRMIQKENSEMQQFQLKEAFKSLSPRQREVLYLKFYKSLGYEDIAEVLDINYQSVRNLMYSGLKVLRNTMTTIGILILLAGI